MSEWISVKEHLPKISIYAPPVVVIYNSICQHCQNPSTDDKCKLGIAWLLDIEEGLPMWGLVDPHSDINIYEIDKIDDGNSKIEINVTHWMPVPDAPEVIYE